MRSSCVSASCTRPGNLCSPCTIRLSRCGSRRFWTLPITQSNNAKATNWVVKALVEATPISGPAWVRKVMSDSRVRLDSATLQMVNVGMFSFLRSRIRPL